MSITMKVKEGQTPVNSIVIIVEGGKDQFEEITSLNVRNQVLAFARANGLPTASGLSGIPTPYPIDENGVCDEQVVTNQRPFSRFQAEYTVNGGLA